jgi:hypothetical protein
MQYRSAIIALLTIFTNMLHGQDIVIRAFHAGDSVILRWAPKDEVIARKAIQFGYIIQRYTLEEYFDLTPNQLDQFEKALTPTSVKPIPANDTNWQHLRKNPMNEVVYRYLYSTKGNDPKSKEIIFGLTLKACDQDIIAAQAMGVCFVDKQVTRNQSYVYRIRIAEPNTKSSGIVTADQKASILPNITKPEAKSMNKSVLLRFSIQSTRTAYAGYIIERSEGDSLHFIRLNELLLSVLQTKDEPTKEFLIYKDTNIIHNRTYYYRIRGYSYFGLTNSPSPMIKVIPQKEFLCYPSIDSISINKDNIKIFPGINLCEDSGRIKACIVSYSSASSSNFKIRRAYTYYRFPATIDTTITGSCYVALGYISQNNDTMYSYPHLIQTADETPPPVPTGLQGKIDSSGIVKLIWEPIVADDLLGYRLFRMNSIKEEPVEIINTIITSNTFIDSITINTLERNVYYTIRSVDKRYNNSEFATPLRLQRPDKISPIAPIPKSITQNDSAIILNWINGDTICLSQYSLLRKTERGALQLIVADARYSSVYTDTNITADSTYFYVLQLRDSSGNKSQANFTPIKFRPRVVSGVKNLKSTINREERVIVLGWELPVNTVDRVIISRTRNNQPLKTIATLNGGATFFSDKTAYPGNTYTYQIRFITKSGQTSQPTTITVEY